MPLVSSFETPKSAILNSPALETRILLGFISGLKIYTSMYNFVVLIEISEALDD